MLKRVKESLKKKFLLLTECGLADRVAVEYLDKTVIGTCTLCPYMKEITLPDVLQALDSPRLDQVVEIPEDTLKKARRALDKMVTIAEGN